MNNELMQALVETLRKRFEDYDKDIAKLKNKVNTLEKTNSRQWQAIQKFKASKSSEEELV